MAKMLTDRQAQAIKPGDKALAHGVKGLLLEPLATRGAGKWRFRYTSPITGKRRVMGLGGYPAVSLKEAGEKAHAALDLIAAGVDPLEVKEDSPAASGIPTFEALARETHAKLLPGWKNAKHGDQWINTLETYAFPLIGAKPVDTLMPKDFADVLHPIWLEKPETAGVCQSS